ncbi:hypothetical protein OSO01_01280 [Oceanobacillus sojae]|uniref:Uncharacterized protein n=1 Tax=Oceanobacillus sojae TaxID=582851 RepID=A0A511ZD67_9BACI|nr:hypothetical protein OSO01_01280 [Oceanobacillus sojae]
MIFGGRVIAVPVPVSASYTAINLALYQKIELGREDRFSNQFSVKTAILNKYFIIIISGGNYPCDK